MNEIADIPFGDELPIVSPADPSKQLPDKGKPISQKLDLRRMSTTTPPAYDFVLPSLLRGSVGALVSPGGTGKSIFALEVASSIACSIAGGSDLLGIGITGQGRVVYLAGEDPEIALHHRFHDLIKNYSLTQQNAIFNNLDLHGMTDCERDLLNDDWSDWLISTAKDARLIIIDTLSRFHLLDENETSDAKQIMRRMERIASRTGAGVLFLHHVSKGSVSGGTADTAQASRGSSVFTDDARWASFLSVMATKEAEGRNIEECDRRKYVRWNICKQNYSAPIADIWFERSAGGVLLPTNFATTAQKAKVYAKASNGGLSDDEW